MLLSPCLIYVRFGRLKWIKCSFGRFRDERVMCGRNKETKHTIQGSTVNYGGDHNLRWP
ncbi:hypothetical protein HanRHA438_Chr02g0066461 [Helianthus annuus]|nr:hypothetical protein HanRHA438_Chr02g0066461 [Helianthus annuus]